MYNSKLLQELARYGRDRISAGEGQDLIATLGAAEPSLFEAYGIGYLPDGFRGALPAQYRTALNDRRLRMGNSLILPATDETGAVVDLMSVSPLRASNLHEEPIGLLGMPALIAQAELQIVDTFAALVHFWRSGKRNVLWLRGGPDAQHNAARLYAAGARSVIVQTRREAPGIAQALHAVGISVRVLKVPKTYETAPATPIDVAMPVAETPVAAPEPGIQYVGYDPKTELASFATAQASYALQVGTDSDSRLEVAVSKGDKLHRDRFDLAVEAQRMRFASSAALRTGLVATEIESHLLQLLDEARKLQATLLNPIKGTPTRVELDATERAEAETYLRAPDLMDRIAVDLEALGWVGEGATKALLYLSAISRKLPEPLWAALRSSPGAGKSFGLDLIAELTPPEDLLHVSRLTDAALYYQESSGLSHKLLVIDEADALTPEVIVALRVLKTRGALSLSHVQRNPANGETKTQFIEARGPVAVLTSTAGKLDAQLLSRCYDLPVDETPEQTERILAAQRRLRATPAFQGNNGQRARLVRLHRNLQRLLEARPVVIPYAERIEFPATSVHHRRDQERFLNLIEASALLHQYQRLRHGEHVIADPRDFEIAARLVAEQSSSHELSRPARELLDAVKEKKLSTFTMDDLLAIRPHWTRYAFRASLKELLDLEFIASLSAGRGRLREYTLLGATRSPERATPIQLRALGDLAKLGERDFTNLTPYTSTG